VSDAGCGSGILRIRPENSAAFWREEFEAVCFDSFVLEQALKLARSVCLRAF
jgi:hypothetical protein